jgi:hypothetical protein
MFSCYHPITMSLLVVLLLGLLLTLKFFGIRAWRRNAGAQPPRSFVRHFGFPVAAFGVLTLLTVWLGSYARSPLSFARQPVLRGFIIQKRGVSPQELVSGEGFSISYSSLAAINPIIQPGKASCSWLSREHAAMDEPESCDIVYRPPSADFDVLQVRVRSACGLPSSSGYLNVQILP